LRRRHKPVHIKDLDWYRYVRRYLWDDETTPYLVPVSRLHRKQADNELFAYCLFFGLLFAGVSFISMTGKAPYGRSFGASLFTFALCCGAIVLAYTKEFLAAVFCALGPASAIAFSLSSTLQPDLELIDRLLLLAFSVLWMRYALRVINIARVYAELPDPPGDPPAGSP